MPVPLERPLTREYVRPLARSAYYTLRGRRARMLSRMRSYSRPVRAPIFIVGCGRSGTTLLGKLIGIHPGVHYLYEPYDFWAAIDPVTDCLQLYSRGSQHCVLGAEAVTADAQHRFNSVMSGPPGLVLVEKSPINALRIGYLDALAPDARFVNIVRDGVDVARSIERVAAVTRRMTFRQPLNEWWGVGDSKWYSLQRDGQDAGYYPREVYALSTDAQRGAYQWLLSMHEAEAWQARLGSRFIQLRYMDLTENPRKALQQVTESLGLSSPGRWLAEAAALVERASNSNGAPLVLPDEMRRDFNRIQASFGFKGRAARAESGTNCFDGRLAGGDCG